MPTLPFQESRRPAELAGLAFSCHRSGAVATPIVAVSGELDIGAVPALDRVLRAAARGAALVVLDLRALEFVDCSGAALLVLTDRRIRAAGGRFVVVRGPAEVQWLFALTGIDRQLEFVDQSPRTVVSALPLATGQPHAARAAGRA